MLPFLHKHRFLFIALGVVFLSVAIGFWVTSGGMTALDDGARYNFSQWLLHTYGLLDEAPYVARIQMWYGALWDLFLAFQTEYIFAWIHDPYWVRLAFTWALFPITLFFTYAGLRRAHVAWPTAALATVFLFATIRFGGYATQTKDFPAASAFWLASLYFWIIWSESHGRKELLLPWKYLAILTVVSVVPYLIRPPLLLHFVLLLGWCGWQALRGGKAPVWRRIMHVLFPFLFGIILVYLLSPAMWKAGFFALESWTKTYTLFSNYPINPNVQFYGELYKPHTLPWWYALGWLPLLTHPLLVVGMVIGFVWFVWLALKKPAAQHFVVSIQNWSLQVSLYRWLLFVCTVSWGAVLLLQPDLYSGIRQILFLYPFIPVCAGLGLARIPNAWQQGLAVICIAVAIAGYAQWGRYSYVHMSPLLPWSNVEHFSGDNRLLCAGRAYQFIEQHVPPGKQILARIPYVYRLYTENSSTSPSFRFIHPKEIQNKAGRVRIMNSKLTHENRLTNSLIAKGEAKLLWRDVLPNGEVACSIIYYNAAYSG